MKNIDSATIVYIRDHHSRLGVVDYDVYLVAARVEKMIAVFSVMRSSIAVIDENTI